MEVAGSELLAALAAGTSDLADALKQRLGGRPTFLVPSGRAGLYHLLCVLPQDRVLLPAYTCGVVVEAVLRAGKTPVFVDVDPETCNMRPEAVTELASADTVILATHQFGIPCDLTKLLAIAESSAAPLIEDAAGSFGSLINGRPAGTQGVAGFLSFEATKTLTLGQGGAVVVSDPELARRLGKRLDGSLLTSRRIEQLLDVLRIAADPIATSKLIYPLTYRIKTRGQRYTAGTDAQVLSPSRLYDHSLPRWQQRLGVRLLRRFDAICARRRHIRSYYERELVALPGIALPRLPPDSDPVLIRFPLRVLTRPKLEFYRRCTAAGLDLAFSFSYTCVPQHDEARFPGAAQLARQVLDLPMYSHLTDVDLERIVAIVRSSADA